MDALQRIKGWIGSLTEIGLMLLALAKIRLAFGWRRSSTRRCENMTAG
jgi:hypothetical protein